MFQIASANRYKILHTDLIKNILLFTLSISCYLIYYARNNFQRLSKQRISRLRDSNLQRPTEIVAFWVQQSTFIRYRAREKFTYQGKYKESDNSLENNEKKGVDSL